MWGFGEGALQKTGILQFFYRSGKVCTRCVEHSSIFGNLVALLGLGWKKKFLPWKKSFLEDGVNYSVTRGLRTGWTRKSESIRITLSDLDPQQVAIRTTGQFHPCFPASRPVSRSVFPSNLGKTKSTLILFKFFEHNGTWVELSWVLWSPLYSKNLNKT